MGFMATAPSIISLLQSCTTETKAWQPVFFSADEATVVKNLIDLILPKTASSPGALDVNIPEFLDLYIFKTYNEEQKKRYKERLSLVLEALGANHAAPASLTPKDYDALLAKYLKASKQQQKTYRSHNKKTDAPNKDAEIFKALEKLRNVTVWSFKNSREIGENVLAYDPIPGMQKGCISIEEATGGKAWSL